MLEIILLHITILTSLIIGGIILSRENRSPASIVTVVMSVAIAGFSGTILIFLTKTDEVISANVIVGFLIAVAFLFSLLTAIIRPTRPAARTVLIHIVAVGISASILWTSPDIGLDLLSEPRSANGKYLFALCYLFLLLFPAHTFTKIKKADEEKMTRGMRYLFAAWIVWIVAHVLYIAIAESEPALVSLPLFAFGGLCMFSLASVGVLRHKNYNLKVILTELFSVILISFLFVDLLFVQSFNILIIKTVTLIAVVLFSNFLIQAVHREITQRKRTEELTNKLKRANKRLTKLDKQKTEYLSIASHQFRSPLTAIQGYASLILDGSYGDIPQKLKEPYERIYQSSKNLSYIVEDFLNVSRIEQGRMKYEKQKTDLKDVVTDIVEEMRPAIGKKNLDVSLDYDGRKRFWVNVDRGKIRQVFVNLIDNAVKYTPEGGSITVSITKDAEAGTVTVAVSDSGVGIDADSLPDLFKRFSRAKKAHEVDKSGAGLGLYVGKKIVDAHGGKIRAESDGEGQGSTFYVTLNLIQ